MDSKSTNTQFLTTKQAAAQMGLAEKDVRSLCQSNALPGAWQSRNRGPWLIPKEAVDSWVRQHESVDKPSNNPVDEPEHEPFSGVRSFWSRQKRRHWFARLVTVTAAFLFVLGVAANAAGVFDFAKDRMEEWNLVVDPMEGDYNVAVAGFRVIGEGSGQESATELANNIANAIDREIGPLEQQMGQRVDVRLPSRVGMVKGDSEQERAERASALAHRLNAHLIIYGVVEVDGSYARVKPEFYVRSDGFSEAAEITGQYRIGSPVSVEKVENIALRRSASSLIEQRFRALTFVIYGLADQAAGNYEQSLESLRQALVIKAWDNPDVLYVLLGNSALKLGDYDQARQYYEAALTGNTTYARAFVGLGSAYYMTALGDVASDTYDTVDQRLLDQAIEQYNRSLDDGIERPPLADVPAKAHLALGQCYLLKAQIAQAQGDSVSHDKHVTMAVEAFQAVIGDYANGRNERIQELAAHAHARLGLVHHLNGEYQSAIEEYQQAVDLIPRLGVHLERAALYEATIAEIYVALQQPAEAIEWYQRAVEDSPLNSEQQLKYRSILEALK